MFGFISNFKTEVYAGFESVKERLVTLEAKVEALFEHTKVVAAQDAEAAKTTAEAAAATVEAIAPVASAVETVASTVATVESDAKQV